MPHLARRIAASTTWYVCASIHGMSVNVFGVCFQHAAKVFAPIHGMYVHVRRLFSSTLLTSHETFTASRHLFAQAIAFAIVQVTQTLWTFVAQSSDVVVGIDVGSTCFEASDILLRRLLPIFFRPCLGEADPDPRDSRLVQHEILQLPWLHGGIFWKESLQVVTTQGLTVKPSTIRLAHEEFDTS